MSQYKLCELRSKDVINICDGKRLGFIHDAVIDVCSGCVKAIIVLCDCRVFSFAKSEELVIPWDKIGCFGADTVLVKLDPSCYPQCKSKKSFKKTDFFEKKY